MWDRKVFSPSNLNSSPGNRRTGLRPAARWIRIAALAAGLAGTAAAADTLTVVIPERDYSTGFWGPYFRSLLEMALEATVDTHGAFEVRMWNISTMHQERELFEVRQGRLDVAWSMTSAERERDLLPVRIPLVKGLLGYRLLLIRAEDRERFRAVDSAADLASFTAGQGLGWPDAEILRANGLPVIEGRDYEGLFAMLAAGRFDYFPRGITEIREELDRRPNAGFAVEDRLLMAYPAPVYFFVNRSRPDLASRLLDGLERCLADGRFDRRFEEAVGESLREARVRHRHVLRLENPLLTEETPLHRPELWYDPARQPE